MIYFGCDGIVPIRMLFLMAEQLTSIATGSLCKVWRGRSARNVWNCGTFRTAWFTTTLQLHLLLCQSRNFRLLKTRLWSPSLLTLLLSHHMISSCFWEWSDSYEGTIDRMSWNSGTITDHPTCIFKKVSSNGASSNGGIAEAIAWTWQEHWKL